MAACYKWTSLCSRQAKKRKIIVVRCVVCVYITGKCVQCKLSVHVRVHAVEPCLSIVTIPHSLEQIDAVAALYTPCHTGTLIRISPHNSNRYRVRDLVMCTCTCTYTVFYVLYAMGDVLYCVTEEGDGRTIRTCSFAM